MNEADKQQLSMLLQSGRSNREIAYWLSRAYPREIETLDLETGDIADYRTTAQGMELEVLDAEDVYKRQSKNCLRVKSICAICPSCPASTAIR